MAKVTTIDRDCDRLKEKCYEMFQTWVQQTANPCWCQIIGALESVELFQLAMKIKCKYLNTGKHRELYIVSGSA